MLCCAFWVPWANVAETSCAFTAPGPALGAVLAALMLMHQEISVRKKSATMGCLAPSSGWPVVWQVCCCANTTALIYRSTSAGWLCRASALLSSSGCWGMVLLYSSPARHDACPVQPATLGSYALNDLTSSSLACALTDNGLRAQSAWGKCGEPFMSGYCAHNCRRCSSGCTDVAPPGGFSCAQQVSRHCKPAASCM